MTVTPNLPVVANPRPLASQALVRQRAPARFGQREKAAILLAALGPGPAAPLLNGVGKDRARLFAKTLSALPAAEAETVDAVLEEFLARLTNDQSVAGGREAARAFLAEVLNPTELEQAMADLGGQSPSVWRSLAELPGAEIRAWVEGEHPQVAAIALTQLPSHVAAKVIEAIPAETARDLVLRMDQSARAEPALVGRIAAAIEASFLPGARLRASGADPAGLVASVMNHMRPQLRDEIFAALGDAKPALAASVQRIMFTFENIATRLNPRDVSQVMKSVDETTLLQALKLEDDGSVAVAEFIFANVSSRLGERLRGDLADMEAPSPKASEAARAALVTAITEARDRGDLRLLDPDDEGGAD